MDDSASHCEHDWLRRLQEAADNLGYKFWIAGRYNHSELPDERDVRAFLGEGGS